LKHVAADRLTLGMYIHEPEASWMDYPDWKTRFLLTDRIELENLKASGVRAFIIDTDRGIDAETAPVPARPASRQGPAAAATPVPQEKCSAEEEFGRAGSIVGRARKSVGEILKQARLGKAVDLGRTLPVIEEISASIDRNASALVSYVRIKAADEYTYLHSVAVCALMINLGRQLLFDDDGLAELGTAGLLHDIGKSAVPAELITRKGPLTAEEMAEVRQHTVRGAELLSRSRNISDVIVDVALNHHERIDGRGYPHNLSGERISLPARMAAVCDVYDAMTSQRSYKDAEQPAEALAEMFASKGQFAEPVLAAFIRSVGIYPIGSLVRLKSGRLAVVVDQNVGDLTKPQVRVFYSIARQARLTPMHLNLLSDGDEILSREKPERWGFAQWNALWAQLMGGKAKRLAA
jgi:putative nucleotidyltransferase with HDIG domain